MERTANPRGNTRLTSKIHKQQIISFIREYRGKYGVSPSHDEIATDGLHLAPGNSGNITPVINALIKEGWLYRSGKGTVRNLMLVQPKCDNEDYWREEES